MHDLLHLGRVGRVEEFGIAGEDVEEHAEVLPLARGGVGVVTQVQRLVRFPINVNSRRLKVYTSNVNKK